VSVYTYKFVYVYVCICVYTTRMGVSLKKIPSSYTYVCGGGWGVGVWVCGIARINSLMHNRIYACIIDIYASSYARINSFINSFMNIHHRNLRISIMHIHVCVCVCV